MIKRDYSFTVRLSDQERASLEALAEQYDLDKSATVRRILRQVNATLPEQGYFSPLNADITFAVQLEGRDGA